MKFVSFNYKDKDRLGVIGDESQIIDLDLALSLEKNIPSNMIDFIKLGDQGVSSSQQRH